MNPRRGQERVIQMDKITEFLEEYKTFKEKAQGHKLTNDEIQFLFAVYRKDNRSQYYQRGGTTPEKADDKPTPATDRQRNYIKQICEAKGVPFNETLFSNMSKMEASRWIDSQLNNGGG